MIIHSQFENINKLVYSHISIDGLCRFMFSHSRICCRKSIC